MRGSNQQRKIIYGLLIVGLFGVMFPYTSWLNEEKKNKDLGTVVVGGLLTSTMLSLLVMPTLYLWADTMIAGLRGKPQAPDADLPGEQRLERRHQLRVATHHDCL